jgi:3-deoxy-manno-octulosonate cytidylyltransferase (CMP-KDO synthetase)
MIKVGIIPSRLQSNRIPEKPLVDICGLPMVVHVLKRAKLSTELDKVYVATDSEKIAQVVKNYGCECIITSSEHKNGTERTAEAIKNIDGDVFVQIMGDEAMLNPDHISSSIKGLADADASFLVTKFTKENSPGDFKVVLNTNSEVMYISRGDIPDSTRNKVEYRLKAYHITTFTRDILEKYSEMKKTSMEKIEDHEFLRLIENGYKVKATKVDSSSISVDYPEDLEYVINEMRNDEYYIKYKN